MKALALLLIVAVPSLGFAQASPAFPQAEPTVSDAPVASSLVPRESASAPMVYSCSAKPIYKRWYFWTGVGAVVVGIVLSSAILVASAQPRQVTPAQLCGPMGCDACIGFNCP